MMNTTIRIGGGTMSVQTENRRVILRSRNLTSGLSISMEGAAKSPLFFCPEPPRCPRRPSGTEGVAEDSLGFYWGE